MGKVYSEVMKANVLNEKGKSVDLFMGCYGIGISRLVAAAIEQNYDKKGINWNEYIAPFEVNIIAVDYEKDPLIAKTSNELYKDLTDMGYEVLLDDRKDSYGIKIKDSELIGIPVNIIIGKSYKDKEEVELKYRDGRNSINHIDEIKTIFNHFK